MVCAQCGDINEITNKLCTGCGGTLMANGGQEKTVTDSGFTNQDFYKAVVGPKNQAYYLKRFNAFDQRGKAGAGWHWPAFFVSFYWFLYRKMWLHALGYIVLPYFLMIPIGLIAGMTGVAEVIGLAYVAYFGAIFIGIPMYANAMYYKQCKKKIAEAQAVSSNVQHQLGELAGRGGTSSVAIWIIVILASISMIGILAAIAIPAYTDYVNKAQAQTALINGQQAAQVVGNYYLSNERLPGSLEEAGFTVTPSPSVSEMTLDGAEGILTITMGQGSLKGKHLQLIPFLSEGGAVEWQCVSEDIPARVLPKGCEPSE